MDPITLGVVLACLVAGFGAGWGLHPDTAVEALEAQSVALSELQEGQRAVLEQAGKPIVIDAELRSTLAEVPVQCREDAGGDPMSVPCQWATCLQYGQSSAQRPECREIETAMVVSLRVEESGSE